MDNLDRLAYFCLGTMILWLISEGAVWLVRRLSNAR